MPTVRVLGLGNVLMGDDGFGPHVVKALEAGWVATGEVSFLELGTPGLDLIPYIDDVDLLIVVDTVAAAGPPGDIRLYGADALARRAARIRLGPHEPGLLEALATLRLAGRGPREVLLVGAIPERTTTGIGLSPAVRAAVPAAAETILREIRGHGASIERRDPPAPPDIWWERGAERPPLAEGAAACTR